MKCLARRSAHVRRRSDWSAVRRTPRCSLVFSLNLVGSQSGLFLFSASAAKSVFGNFLLTNAPVKSFNYPGCHFTGTMKKGSMMNDAQKPLNKTEVITALAEATELTNKQVSGVLDELANLIGENLGDGGPGEFTVPGMMKLKVAHKPATEEHEGINPFTKEPMTIKAKPASKKIKIVPLKGLKDRV